MMDISMYGNHHPTHSSGFQNDLSATGYPHYYHHLQTHQNVPSYAASTGATASAAIASPNANPNNSNHFYSTAAVAHPHLYSPTAIEYGIHTTSSNNSPSEQYYEHSGTDGYFATGAVNNNSSGSPENHIISTDNGLSYTNLDYIAYQQAQAHAGSAGQGYVDEKIHLSHHYNEEMLMSGSQNPLHHHHHHHHHANNPWHTPNNYSGSNSGDSGTTMVANQMQAISGTNLQNQQPIQHNMHSPNSIQSTSPTLQSQQQQQSENSCSQQQAVPTYKWMQVKRNVPKPQSE